MGRIVSIVMGIIMLAFTGGLVCFPICTNLMEVTDSHSFQKKAYLAYDQATVSWTDGQAITMVRLICATRQFFETIVCFCGAAIAFSQAGAVIPEEQVY
jgi:hypothetical protein